MSGGTPFESPAAADGPLLASATSALQELVFSVNSARGDMEARAAAAQAEMTGQLQGTREAASNAFRDATEITDFFEKECAVLQEQVQRETERRVAAEADRARLATESGAAQSTAAESGALESDLQTCRDELEASRQREEVHAAQLEDAREELRQLRLGAGPAVEGQNGAHPAHDDLETSNAALQLAHAENERLKRQVEQLDDQVEKELQARAEVEAAAKAQSEELAHCTASSNDARVELEKMRQRQREADEERNTAQAEVHRLQREMTVQQARHTEAMEAEQAIHERECASLRDLASPPVRRVSSVDDAAQSIEYELHKLRTEHEQQLAIMKQDADALKQEVERKHNTLLTMHSAVEVMREEHESFRQSTQRSSASAEKVADLARENEVLKQQLELSHNQLQLAMSGSPLPFPEDQAKVIQLENDLSRERAIKVAIEKELQAAQHKHRVQLESADRRHAAEREAIDLNLRAAQDDATVLVKGKEQLQRTVEAMNKTLADKQADLDETHQQLLQKEAELASTAAAHADTKQRHATQVQEHTEREKQLQEEADLLADEKASLERHAAEVDRALKENQANMLVEKHELERKEESLRAEAEQQVAAWKKKHEDLHQAHQELERQLQTNREQLRIEQDTHARTASERDETKAQHASLVDEYQTVLQQRDESRVEHAKATAAHTEVAAARDALRVEHTQVCLELKSASDQVTKLSAHQQALELELETARRKAADAHRIHQDAMAEIGDEMKILTSALQVSETSYLTVKQELDDQEERNRRIHEESVVVMEERNRLAKELDEEKDAHYKSKERAAVELSESKQAMEKQVSTIKDEAMQQLAAAKRSSEEGYATLQQRFSAQVAMVEGLKEDHAEIQARWEEDRTRWEEDRRELGSVHELSLARYEDAIELAERHNMEAKSTAAQHSSLIRDHTEASEEVDQLRSSLEAMSKELTEAQSAHAAATAELDAHRAKTFKLSAVHKREIERIKGEVQQVNDKDLAAHRKESNETTAQLRGEHEQVIAELRAQLAAAAVHQQRSQELVAQVEECQAQIRAHEEIKAQLHDDNDKLSAQLHDHRLQQMELESKLAEAEDTLTESSAAAAQEVQQANEQAARAHTELQAAEQTHAGLKDEAERLQAELRAVEANLAAVQEESEADRRSDMDRLTASLTIAHDNLKRLEEERVEQAQVMEMKEKELNEWRARALGGENALLRSASQALALSEGQAISRLDAEDSGSQKDYPREKSSPTVSVADSAASVGSRPRRGSWASDAGRVIYECELGTGFRGTLEEVRDHEARIRKMREDTKKDLSMMRSPRTSFSTGSYAVPRATAAAVVSASDSRYTPRATSSRPVSSHVLAPAAAYSSRSRYPEEDAYGARSLSPPRGDASVRSTEASFSNDRDTHSASSLLASKAAARKQRWASAGTTSRAPRREPGVTGLSEGEPPAEYNPRHLPPTTPSRRGTEDRD